MLRRVVCCSLVVGLFASALPGGKKSPAPSL